MAKQLQVRRGTTMSNNLFTGAEGEITMDTVTKGLHIHDGSKRGGYKVPTLVDVQYPSAENNYTWYRKYSDGWVEQGGQANQPASTSDTAASINISLPVEMADNNYAVLTTGSVIIENGGTGGGWAGMRKDSSSTTTTLIITSNRTVSSFVFSWEVKGMAA